MANEHSKKGTGPIDPVKAGELLQHYFDTVSPEERAANFAPIAAKILADMDAADESE